MALIIFVVVVGGGDGGGDSLWEFILSRPVLSRLPGIKDKSAISLQQPTVA